jgi:hypothetical protein
VNADALPEAHRVKNNSEHKDIKYGWHRNIVLSNHLKKYRDVFAFSITHIAQVNGATRSRLCPFLVTRKSIRLAPGSVSKMLCFLGY